MEQVNKEWRCPKCDRLLGDELGFNKLEIHTANKQRIMVSYNERWGDCKCGYKIRTKNTIIKK